MKSDEHLDDVYLAAYHAHHAVDTAPVDRGVRADAAGRRAVYNLGVVTANNAREAELWKLRQELRAVTQDRDRADQGLKMTAEARDKANARAERFSQEVAILLKVVEKADNYVKAARNDATPGGRDSGIKSTTGGEPREAFEELEEALFKWWGIRNGYQ